MRLDLFSRQVVFASARTIAQKLCDAGLVFINENLLVSPHSEAR